MATDYSSLYELDTPSATPVTTPAAKLAEPVLPGSGPEHREEPSGDEFSMQRDNAINNSAPDTNLGTSVVRGALQDASYGFGDEISAAIDYGVSKVPSWVDPYKLLPRAAQKLHPDNLPPLTNSEIPYSVRRDAYRNLNQKAQEANPKAYLVGGLVGSLIAPGPKVPVKGISQTLVRGAGLGMVSGLGHSDVDLTTGNIDQAKQAGTDTLVGGATGAAGAALGTGVAKVGNKLASKALDKFAEKLGLSKDATEVLNDDKIVRNIATSSKPVEHKVAQLEKIKDKLGSELQEHILNLDNSGEVFQPQPIIRELTDKIAELESRPTDANLDKITKIRSVISDLKSHFGIPVEIAEDAPTQPNKLLPGMRPLRQLVNKFTKQDKEIGDIVNKNLIKQVTDKLKQPANPVLDNDVFSSLPREEQLTHLEKSFRELLPNLENAHDTLGVSAKNSEIELLTEFQNKLLEKAGKKTNLINKIKEHPFTALTAAGEAAKSIYDVTKHGVSLPALATGIGVPALLGTAKGLAFLSQKAKDGAPWAIKLMEQTGRNFPNTAVGAVQNTYGLDQRKETEEKRKLDKETRELTDE